MTNIHKATNIKCTYIERSYTSLYTFIIINFIIISKKGESQLMKFGTPPPQNVKYGNKYINTGGGGCVKSTFSSKLINYVHTPTCGKVGEF